MHQPLGIQLIVGLGNPGPQYETTRHNVGFWLVRALAAHYQQNFNYEAKFKGELSSIATTPHSTRLFLPLTFMNLSGTAVTPLSHFYKIPPAALLVVHDELDLPPGTIRLKKDGSANGHNGVQNIMQHLGSSAFWRLRIGIGKPATKKEVIQHVLHAPSQAETLLIQNEITTALTIIPDLIQGKFASAMQLLHSSKQH